ncbi:NADH-quinone oxidoreductase subunit M [Fictibacillus enclensis]|uniref:NADH:ubiquinone oxidoreductase subunit M n=1 Tax=Fictibacillus enclensis TaxID=1017270 RepID=A0A0V8J3Y1_9BACL|nr:NADH-quinone oxidoreductase subunit M [Fictibacillus enclensis]KSU81874.1 NADH:ubiquinone oxidoreductase subunit M [Fictibacillus enclensis]SCC27306.1 NADH-quinone oxidoreductase subunit M [Fictibacillus enclensis]
MNYMLSLLVFSPLVGILALSFLSWKNERAIKLAGLFGTLLPLILVLIAAAGFHSSVSGLQMTEQANWISYTLEGLNGSMQLKINYELGITGLSLVLLILTAVVSFLAALASWNMKNASKSFFIFFLILELGMLGVFASQNLFLFFIFFEITLIPMFFLIGRWGYADREKAAYSFLIYNGIGSAILLIVFVALFMKTGTLNYGELTKILASPDGAAVAGSTFRLSVLVSLLIAFGIKLPIFPLHTWMLRVHVQAPPSIVMLHSGILLKIGAYGLFTFGVGFFPEEFKKLGVLIAILGVINLLYGAFLAIVQTDLKKVLAYSSVSHMGIVLIGLAAMNEAGVKGAIFQLVSHGLISALLFFLIGVLYERSGSSDIQDFSGLAAAMPVTAGVLLAGGLASLGLPGMSGFISEFLAFIGLFQTMPIIAAIGALGIILTAVYILRAVLAVTFGPKKETHSAFKDLTVLEKVPAFVLLALVLLIGVYPEILSKSLTTVLDTILLGLRG